MWLLFLDKFVLQCAMTQIHLYFSKCPWLLNKVSNFFFVFVCLFVLTNVTAAAIFRSICFACWVNAHWPRSLCLFVCLFAACYFQINLFRLLAQCALTQVRLPILQFASQWNLFPASFKFVQHFNFWICTN